MIFSFSRLNLYEQCPYRFYNKYILGKQEPVTQPLALGKAVHKAIEDKIKGVPHDEAVLNGYAEADFHEDINQDDISALVNKAPIHPNMGETEIYFKLPLSTEKDVPLIQGYIDLYQPNGSITDWKTNRIPYDVLDSRQVALYSWVISQLKGLDFVEGSYFFLRFRKRSSNIFTYEDMDQARQWALTTANEINNKLELLEIFTDETLKLFQAEPSRLCGHCPFAWECINNNSFIKTLHGN
ncbi:hypothetical protein CIL03_08510 [Virgibacillus indicus]|uniref:PD-(D/E)XK endonuclease-like domain-containing protein n=1 Tax=Virgibacillus indicus TaxID=2024554 RepID=A0A265NAK0_9BACI|nr:PD-(D/E)XK nuclease family protein [Virgibacillus indicus]OZU89048.1 hypothetical protein CIL03_08510 [Virgibacillus indicus]